MTAQRRGRPQAGTPPTAEEWQRATPVSFAHDWRGENADPARETQVRMLWDDERLHIQFHCRYRGLHTFAERNCRRDQLWLRDVAEVFIQTGRESTYRYTEFEISPNGCWLDLGIAPGVKARLGWDIRSRVRVLPDRQVWVGEMSLPLPTLAGGGFTPEATWRVNLFRIEGAEPRRFYSAWRPTRTPQANFHVPECFGELAFGA
ncbi:MAG: carbohydrate-binding family 9-like protein [Acidobacteriota bacterium]|jgi:hypothetical protein|nr:carbohydrate-binding family 9-like protein [Acidobacteriota bacterium]